MIVTLILLLLLVIVGLLAFIDCTEVYHLNAGTAGTALADAAFKTAATGNARRIVWGDKDYGFPPIVGASGVEALAAGGTYTQQGLGRVVLTTLKSNSAWQRWHIPLPWWSSSGDVTAADRTFVRNGKVFEPLIQTPLGLPWNDGDTLVDGTISKVYASLANSYTTFVLYRRFGPQAPPSRGGLTTIVQYDKGGDVTAATWTTLEEAAQNASGELQKDHMYRLAWAALDAQALADTEALAARITVPGFPPLIFVGGGSYFGTYGVRRIVMDIDSLVMRGDSIHKVEALAGAVCQPLVTCAWEDMGLVPGASPATTVATPATATGGAGVSGVEATVAEPVRLANAFQGVRQDAQPMSGWSSKVTQSIRRRF